MRRVTEATAEVVHSITCDVCGKTDDHWVEMQEYARIKDCAGYGQRHLTDGDVWEIDICQDCIHNLLGQFIRVIRPSPY